MILLFEKAIAIIRTQSFEIINILLQKIFSNQTSPVTYLAHANTEISVIVPYIGKISFTIFGRYLFFITISETSKLQKYNLGGQAG